MIATTIITATIVIPIVLCRKLYLNVGIKTAFFHLLPTPEMYACKSNGSMLLLRDEQAKNACCLVGPAEWGVWVAQETPEALSAYWSKWDTAVETATGCRLSTICLPSGRVVLDGEEKRGRHRSFSVGARVCELYAHTNQRGLVVGLTILPADDYLWKYPRSSELLRELADQAFAKRICHVHDLPDNSIKRRKIVGVPALCAS